MFEKCEEEDSRCPQNNQSPSNLINSASPSGKHERERRKVRGNTVSYSLIHKGQHPSNSSNINGAKTGKAASYLVGGRHIYQLTIIYIVSDFSPAELLSSQGRRQNHQSAHGHPMMLSRHSSAH